MFPIWKFKTRQCKPRWKAVPVSKPLLLNRKLDLHTTCNDHDSYDEGSVIFPILFLNCVIACVDWFTIIINSDFFLMLALLAKWSWSLVRVAVRFTRRRHFSRIAAFLVDLDMTERSELPLLVIVTVICPPVLYLYPQSYSTLQSAPLCRAN